jgi:hypothetical protein
MTESLDFCIPGTHHTEVHYKSSLIYGYSIIRLHRHESTPALNKGPCCTQQIGLLRIIGSALRDAVTAVRTAITRAGEMGGADNCGGVYVEEVETRRGNEWVNNRCSSCSCLEIICTTLHTG